MNDNEWTEAGYCVMGSFLALMLWFVPEIVKVIF